MPPKGSKIARFDKESSIEHTSEYDDFIKKLTEYHEKRGTQFEAEPKVGSRHIHLLNLYDRIIGEGGYDLVSDTKAKPLMWRKIAEEFIGKGPHLAAQAFQVKSAYYKNLAAYEISEHWKEDPPPKEILEDLTAKGGNIRGRTLETFERPGFRDGSRLTNGNDSDSEEESKGDAMDVDESALTGRSSRGLRQAPPQRVLFQPDINTSRHSRASATAQAASPSPGINPLHAINQLSNPQLTSTNTTLASYEPRSQLPLTLKPVTTPTNNPDCFKLKRKQIDEAAVPTHVKRFKGILLPGSGFIGPNIYSRAQLALQSGIPEEERYALHHLVKISHERGDKYRFDQFPGLAELLIEKVLQTGGLFYNVKWNIDYSGGLKGDAVDILDGLHGTSDVLAKMQSLLSLDMTDSVQSDEYHRELNTISEAALILRNMVMLEENAIHVARIAPVRDMACVVLSLNHSTLVELQHYVLEIVEQLSVHLMIDANQPLYKILLQHISGTDRGRIITALRATARLGMRARENKRLEQVPQKILSDVCSWLLIEDEELRSACLDFLYQFTSVADNIDPLIKAINVPLLVENLVKLLFFGAEKVPSKLPPQVKENVEEESAATRVPRIANGLLENLLSYDEPERSSHWLRMCFIDDSSAEMTQIDLWKSYQGTFEPYSNQRPHLIAGEFIKNVSNTFHGASAQVAGQNKYVIRGIKPRKVPVDYKGRELSRCQWRVDRPFEQVASVFAHSDGGECGQWFPSSESMLEHILTTHLRIPRKKAVSTETKPGQEVKKSILSSFDFAAAPGQMIESCAWSTCRHRSAIDAPSSTAKWALLALHIETHLPDPERSSSEAKKEVTKDAAKVTSPFYHLNTSVDETHRDACGLPLGAALCLRNIARGLARLADEGEQVEQLLQLIPCPEGDAGEKEPEVVLDSRLQEDDGDGEDATNNDETTDQKAPTTKMVLIRRIFASIRMRLFFTMGYNDILKEHVADILRHLARSGAF